MRRTKVFPVEQRTARAPGKTKGFRENNLPSQTPSWAGETNRLGVEAIASESNTGVVGIHDYLPCAILAAGKRSREGDG